jgi:hypothetical protein
VCRSTIGSTGPDLDRSQSHGLPGKPHWLCCAAACFSHVDAHQLQCNCQAPASGALRSVGLRCDRRLDSHHFARAHSHLFDSHHLILTHFVASIRTSVFLFFKCCQGWWHPGLPGLPLRPCLTLQATSIAVSSFASVANGSSSTLPSVSIRLMLSFTSRLSSTSSSSALASTSVLVSNALAFSSITHWRHFSFSCLRKFLISFVSPQPHPSSSHGPSSHRSPTHRLRSQAVRAVEEN